MFNAASKLYFTLAGAAVLVGFAYVVVTSDRVGFTNLVFAGAAAVGLGLAAFAFVPRESLIVAVDEPAEPRPADTTDTAGATTWAVLAALALGLVAAGAAVDGTLIALGAAVGLIATFGWLAQAWREHPSWTQAMTDRINDRFVVPFGLPVMIFVLAGIGVISVSRLFLAVSATAAAIVGALVAFVLLGVFYLLSTRDLGRPALTTVATVAVGFVLAAGVAGALVGEREFHHAGAGEHEFVLTAENLEFDKDALDLPAASEVTLRFENHEPVPHNVSIYESEGGDVIFEGEILDAEGEVDYTFETPAAGQYWFQCDVHPDAMNGIVNVSEEASEVEGGDHADETGSSGGS